MATHSSILAWKIPWMEERGRLQSVGSQRVGHDWAISPPPPPLWAIKTQFILKGIVHLWFQQNHRYVDLKSHFLGLNFWSVSNWGFPGGSEVKASARNAGDLGSIPGSGRSPGEGNGNPLQYSCLENPMDGGASWAAAHGVAKSPTRLSNFNSIQFLELWFNHFNDWGDKYSLIK